MKEMMDIIANLDDKTLNSLLCEYVLMALFNSISAITPRSKDEYYTLIKSMIHALKNEGDAILSDSYISETIQSLLAHLTKIRVVLCSVPPHPQVKGLQRSVLDVIKFLKTNPRKKTIPPFVIPFLKKFISFRLYVYPKIREEVKDLVALAHMLEDRMNKSCTKDDYKRRIKGYFEEGFNSLNKTTESFQKLDGFKELKDALLRSKEMVDKNYESSVTGKAFIASGEAFLSFINKHKELSDGLPEGIIEKIKGHIKYIKEKT